MEEEKNKIVVKKDTSKERRLYMIIDDKMLKGNAIQQQNFYRFLKTLDEVKENVSLSQRFYMSRHELEESEVSIEDDKIIVILGPQDFKALDRRIINRFTIFKNYYKEEKGICNSCVTENCPDRDVQLLKTCSKHSTLEDGYNERGVLICEACEWDKDLDKFYCSVDMPLESEFCRGNTCHLKPFDIKKWKRSIVERKQQNYCHCIHINENEQCTNEDIDQLECLERQGKACPEFKEDAEKNKIKITIEDLIGMALSSFVFGLGFICFPISIFLTILSIEQDMLIMGFALWLWIHLFYLILFCGIYKIIKIKKRV